MQGEKGICPQGWHIPTKDEMGTLITVAYNDGNSLKAVGQGTGKGAGTNTSGFSALLGGSRGSSIYFYGLGVGTDFWVSSEIDASSAYSIHLFNDNSNISPIANIKGISYSIRCLRN